MLLADDEFLIALGLEQMLRAEGYDVVGTARNGIEAVEMATELAPDVVILDLKMPRLDGVGAARQIRDRVPVPIVMLTAYQSTKLVRESTEAGAGAYLVKPVNASQLVRSIEVARERFAELAEVSRRHDILETRVAERTQELALVNEALRASIEVKDSLFANMNHELRTPLNAIMGLSEALQEDVYGPLSPKQRESLKTIEESGARLLSLVNDVLDLSRIQSSDINLELQELALDSLCYEGLVRKRRLALAQNQQLIEPTGGPFGRVLGDPQRLLQVLLILLDNAIKFTEKGGQLGIELSEEPGHGTVTITVWDTGPGIPPDQAALLMQPFTQLSQGLARSHNGAGLGLAIASRLVALHHGELQIADGVPTGCRVSVVLPQSREQRAQAPLQRDD